MCLLKYTKKADHSTTKTLCCFLKKVWLIKVKKAVFWRRRRPFFGIFDKKWPFLSQKWPFFNNILHSRPFYPVHFQFIYKWTEMNWTEGQFILKWTELNWKPSSVQFSSVHSSVQFSSVHSSSFCQFIWKHWSKP